MGRYAQKRRGGGGPPTPSALNHMILATITSDPHIEITYSAEVDAGDFTFTDFLTVPNAIEPISFGQASATSIDVEWSDSVLLETAVAYTGGIANIETPQTIAIT